VCGNVHIPENGGSLMKRFLCTVAMVAVIFCAGCGKDAADNDAAENDVKNPADTTVKETAPRTPDAVMEDTIATMDEMAALLNQVKTVEDANKHKAALTAVTKKMEALQVEGAALQKLSPEEKEALKKKYEERVKATAMKVFPAMMRISMDKELSEALKDTGIMRGPAPQPAPSAKPGSGKVEGNVKSF
jgi:ABC-type Fe3+-citrate transport system substrate-binding protein